MQILANQNRTGAGAGVTGGTEDGAADRRTIRVGDRVSARRQQWRVLDVRRFDVCQIVSLAGIGVANAGAHCSLVAPFDIIEPMPSAPKLRVVSLARWRRAC